jgi:hypothetical protein
MEFEGIFRGFLKKIWLGLEIGVNLGLVLWRLMGI